MEISIGFFCWNFENSIAILSDKKSLSLTFALCHPEPDEGLFD